LNSSTSHAQEQDDGGEIINVRAIWNWIAFGLRAARKRKWTVLGATLVTVSLAAAALMVLPKEYQVRCALLAQHSEVLATRSAKASDPTQTAPETVLSRDNLIGLVKQTKLVEHWQQNRSGLHQLKDKIMAAVFSVPDEEERIRRMAEYLGTKMQVWTNKGLITIQVMWRDPDMAVQLADAAQQSFLEARRVPGVSTFVESASIMEGHADELRKQVEERLTELQQIRAKLEKEEQDAIQAATTPKEEGAKPAAVAAPASQPVPEPAGPSPAALAKRERLAELPVQIKAKQRILDELESYQRRRLTELQTKLEAERTKYTDNHPAVADIQQQIAVAQSPSPQASRLRQEIAQLESEVQRLSGSLESVTAEKPKHNFRFQASRGGPAPAVKLSPQDALLAELARPQEEDPKTEYARARLGFAIDNYQTLQEQIRLAKLDLDTAQAAFKHRYKVVTPPERPRGPASPKPPLIIAAALISGLFIGLTAAFGLEVRDGIVRESWQVDQFFALPVLAEVQLPASTRDPGE